MKTVLYSVLLLVLAGPAWAEPPAKVTIEWRYSNFAGPVSLYEVRGQPALWETKSVPNLAAAPVGKQIVDPSFNLAPGQRKRFALVVQNPSDQMVYFFAAPHMVHPEEGALGFKFKCLCINEAYKIGPKETWYRIVELRLSEHFVGNELTITHALIGIDQKRAEAFPPQAAKPDL